MSVQSIRLFGLDGLANVGKVSDAVFRGAQPGPSGYHTLSNMGVRTVLNLSKEDETRDVLAARMEPVSLPFGFFGDIERERVEAALSVVFNPACAPVFVHCAQGCDRTGLVIACYRIRSGWTNALAAEEMSAFGYHFVWSHFMEFVRSFK